MRDAETPWTVGALTQAIAGTLEEFGTLTVRGELSQVKVYPSGHLYATLKDAEAILSVVMWRSQVVRGGALPKEGAQVLVRGNLSVYGPRGQYQLQATRITPLGAGDLHARFLELKSRLEAEGLFAGERKRALPFLPRAVGLATAAGSAALADMLHSIRARFPRMPIVHAPCLVQGAGAAASIQAALERLGTHPDVDVIICGRGGGSLEDLWAFNEEAVVRALAACPVPVVSAVGHETDTTLADLAADVRAKTPTAAGEMVVPVEAELLDALVARRRRLDQEISEALRAAGHRLQALATHRALSTPRHLVAMRVQRLDELQHRLHEAGRERLRGESQRCDEFALRLRIHQPRSLIGAHRERLAVQERALGQGIAARVQGGATRLAALAGHLQALSPLGVVARGYALVTTGEGALVRSIAQVAPGAGITARVGDGVIEAAVTGTRPAPAPGPGS